jgi:hypothetical protein
VRGRGGALTVLGLMLLFLCLCLVMRAVAHVLASDFDDVLKLPRQSVVQYRHVSRTN